MNSKGKGSSFERECSRMLSLWWTNGKRDDAIWRSASSGALTTVGKGRYLAHTGDFAATDGEAELLFKHVIIEAKRGYNRYSVQDLLDVPEKSLAKSPVYEMVIKLIESGKTQKKHVMLLWKRDRRDLLVFTDIRYTNMIPYMTLLCPDSSCLIGMPWQIFSRLVPASHFNFDPIVSATRTESVLTPPVVSSELKPVTPS